MNNYIVRSCRDVIVVANIVREPQLGIKKTQIRHHDSPDYALQITHHVYSLNVLF